MNLKKSFTLNTKRGGRITDGCRERTIPSSQRACGRRSETEQLEIEIVNPDMVTLDDGSMEVTIIPDAEGVLRHRVV